MAWRVDAGADGDALWAECPSPGERLALRTPIRRLSAIATIKRFVIEKDRVESYIPYVGGSA